MDNKRLNDCVREYAGNPDLVEDQEWKVFRSSPEGAFWYIPEDDDAPGDDNIIEGETGELFYLDRDDAYAQWGEEKKYEDSIYYESYRNLRQILDGLPDDFELSDGADTWTVYALTQAIHESYYRSWMEEAEDLLEPEDYALQRMAIVKKTEGGWENAFWFEKPAW